MQIEFEENSYLFRAVEVGEVFQYGKDYYMRIEPIECTHLDVKLNALHIETGIATHLDDFTRIIPVKGKVVIEG